LFPMTLLNH